MMSKEKQKAYREKYWPDYYAANKERICARLKMKRDSDIESHRAIQRDYYAKNRAAVLAIITDWRRKNPDRCSAIQKKWYDANKEKVFKKNENYRKRNPHKHQQNSSKRRARINKCEADSTAKLFYKFVRSKNSIPCYYCGNKISGSAAHIDHIVALSKSGNHSSENLCASCPDCNLSKNNKSVTEWKKHGQLIFNV